jgi:hypothetical protein
VPLPRRISRAQSQRIAPRTNCSSTTAGGRLRKLCGSKAPSCRVTPQAGGRPASRIGDPSKKLRARKLPARRATPKRGRHCQVAELTFSYRTCARQDGKCGAPSRAGGRGTPTAPGWRAASARLGWSDSIFFLVGYNCPRVGWLDELS